MYSTSKISWRNFDWIEMFISGTNIYTTVSQTNTKYTVSTEDLRVKTVNVTEPVVMSRQEYDERIKTNGVRLCINHLD